LRRCIKPEFLYVKRYFAKPAHALPATLALRKKSNQGPGADIKNKEMMA